LLIYSSSGHAKQPSRPSPKPCLACLRPYLTLPQSLEPFRSCMRIYIYISSWCKSYQHRFINHLTSL
jgi:hypothetical protein